MESTKAYYAREGAVKGPFMPPSAVLNPSYEQYKWFLNWFIFYKYLIYPIDKNILKDKFI